MKNGNGIMGLSFQSLSRNQNPTLLNSMVEQNLIKKAMKEIDKKVDLSNQLEEKAKEKLKEEEKSSSENKEG